MTQADNTATNATIKIITDKYYNEYAAAMNNGAPIDRKLTPDTRGKLAKLFKAVGDVQKKELHAINKVEQSIFEDVMTGSLLDRFARETYQDHLKEMEGHLTRGSSTVVMTHKAQKTADILEGIEGLRQVYPAPKPAV